jgi:hypothetical protein
MKAVGAGYRLLAGKRLGQRRDWFFEFFEQVEDRPVSGVPQRLRKSLELVPDPVG